MQSFISFLVLAVVFWRVIGFVNAYRRTRTDAIERQAELEQKKDWARRMQGRSEKGK